MPKPRRRLIFTVTAGAGKAYRARRQLKRPPGRPRICSARGAGTIALGDESAQHDILKEREKVRGSGGLHVMETGARTRRIDNQLRGRPGRQATRRASWFHVLLEDPAPWRVFGDRSAVGDYEGPWKTIRP